MSSNSAPASPFEVTAPIEAPTYPLVPHDISWHDHTRIDPFYWMRGEKLFGGTKDGSEDGDEDAGSDEAAAHEDGDAEVDEDGDEDDTHPPPSSDIVSKALTPHFVVADSVIKAMLKAENAYTASYLPMTIKPYDLLVAGRDPTPVSIPGSPLLALSASASSVAHALSSQGGTPSSPLLSRGGFPAACAQKGFTSSPVATTASFPTLPITTGIRGPATEGTKAAAKREVASALETPVSYLYKEMKSRWKQTDSSTPAMGGAYWYYSREQKGKDYHQVCRRRITDANRGLAMEVMRLRNEAIASGSGAMDVNVPFCPEEEEVVLDVNVLQEEMKLEFVDVIGPISSPCDTKMVYAVDNSNGQEIYTLYICDISPTILKAGLGKPTTTTTTGDGEDAAPAKKRFGGGKGAAAKKENFSKKLKKGDDNDDASSELSSEEGASDGEAEAKAATTNGPTCHVVRANPPVVRTIELFDCSGDIGWVDCNIIAYTTLDDSQRAHRLVLHDLRLPQEEHLQLEGATSTTSKKNKKKGTNTADDKESAKPSSATTTLRHLNDIIIHDEKDARYSVGCLSCLDDECHAAFGSSSKECEELYVVPNVPSTQEMYRTRGSIFKMPTTTTTSKSDVGKGKGQKTSRGVTSRNKKSDGGPASSEVYSADLKALIEALSPKSAVSEVDASRAFISATNGGGGDVGRTIWDYKNSIQCMVPREDDGKETDMECDASHHPYLMPISGTTTAPTAFDSTLTGGFIFVANQKPKFSEFGVFYAPDSAVLAAPGSSPTSMSHIRNRWVQLVEVKQYVTVQSIELIKDYVLLTCIDKGFPSCYVCSMDDVRRIISIQQKELATSATPSTFLTYGKELRCVGDFLLHMKRSILSPTSSCESGASLYCVSADWGSANFNQCYTLTASVSHISEKSQSFEINLQHFMEFFGVSTATQVIDAYKGLYDAWAEKDNQEVHDLGLLSLLAATDEVGVAQTALLRREEVMANGIKYNASEYVSERLWVPAKNSVKKEGEEEVLIPVTLTYRKDKYIPGESPILLYLYGSYGECTDPEFNRNRLSVVDRGVAYAIVSVRGGGELGRGWRDAGRMANRLNSTLDLISVAEYLREAPPTATWRPHPNKVAIMGGSAGGTIVAAAANRRPELFCAVLADVPFVDCLTSMLDERIPLTTVEWEEWGNPVADPIAYRTILEYSPQDNVPGFNELVLNPQMDRMKADDEAEDVAAAEGGAAEDEEEDSAELEVIKSAKRLWKAQPIPQGATSTSASTMKVLSPEVEARVRSYPNLYVSSGLGDSRVAYWEPMAYVARVRATCRAYKAHLEASSDATSSSAYHAPLILHQCELSGGHGGASGRFAYLKDIAREYAFLLHIWGIPLIEE